jgi:hypothetical protein
MLRRKIQPFEIALLVILIAQLAYEKIYLNIWEESYSYFEGIFFLIFAAKYYFEGMRTESLLALITEIHIITTKIIKIDFILYNSLVFVFFGLYLFFIMGFPFYNYPRPTGPYLVGYRYFPLSNNLKASVFYPTETCTRRAYWLTSLDYFESLFDESPFRPLLRFISTFYLKIKMNVNDGAKLATNINKLGKEKMPLLIFEHDLGEHSNSYSRLFSDLSSNGYLIFCLDHVK